MPTVESTIEFMAMINRKPVNRFRWVEISKESFEVQGDLGNANGIKQCFPVAGFDNAQDAISLQRNLNARFGF
jgi:hypothetical protein